MSNVTYDDASALRQLTGGAQHLAYLATIFRSRYYFISNEGTSVTRSAPYGCFS